jgi:hypothetical protein
MHFTFSFIFYFFEINYLLLNYVNFYFFFLFIIMDDIQIIYFKIIIIKLFKLVFYQAHYLF